MDVVSRSVEALGLTEWAGWVEDLHDGGRALGRWQTHPAWLFEQAERFHLQPGVDETWHSFQFRVVTAWFNHALVVELLRPLLAAMWFHKGHFIPEHGPDWDAAYAQRFVTNWQVAGPPDGSLP